MRIDAHSVVYFINEEYGVVIRANGATKEVAAWDERKKCFGRRLDLRMASFLARTDRYEGKWCAAHPTYSRVAAEKAAKSLKMNLPGMDGMHLATASKLMAVRTEIQEKGADRMIVEIIDR